LAPISRASLSCAAKEIASDTEASSPLDDAGKGIGDRQSQLASRDVTNLIGLSGGELSGRMPECHMRQFVCNQAGDGIFTLRELDHAPAHEYGAARKAETGGVADVEDGDGIAKGRAG
jgi:hypothetical protein